MSVVSASLPTQKLDVAREVKVDHDNVRDLFGRFEHSTDKEERTMLSNTLVREMAVHEDAEEISVYALMLKMGMVQEVEKDKQQRAEIKKAVEGADMTKTDHPDHDQILQNAVAMFLRHADEEEMDDLPKLTEMLDPDENERAAKDFLKARKSVPSRPHPWAPQSGGMAQKATGMQGKVHDKMVETVLGRDFVDVQDLKHQHAEY